MTTGEERAWEKLSGLKQYDICRNAGVLCDKNDNYILRSFDMDFLISPEKRIITNISPEGEKLIKRYSYFFNLLALYYLINAKDIPLSGRPVKPENIQGGVAFFRGTHILPLDKIAEKYNNDKTGFIEKGKEFSGRIVSYGDASVELLPMPRIPVTLILWLSDDEFPARAELLFDSTCEMHIPIDMLWSVAMLSALVML